PGARVWLAKGEHDAGNVALPDGVEVIGACVAETIVRGAFTVSDVRDVVVRRLRLASAEGAAVTVDRGGAAIEEVWIEAAESGVRAVGGSIVSIERAMITGGAAGGVMLELGGGALAAISELALTDARGRGVVVTGETTDASLRRVRVSSVEGRALELTAGASAVVEELTVDGRTDEVLRRGGGIRVEGASATLTRVVVRDVVESVEPAEPGGDVAGGGLAVHGSTVRAAWLVLSGNAPKNLDVATSSITAVDVVTRDHSPFTPRGAGIAIASSTIALGRVLVEGWEGTAVLVDGTRGLVEDLGVGARAEARTRFGGVLLWSAPALTVRRATVDGAAGSGVEISATASNVTVEDLVVTGTRVAPDDPESSAGIMLGGGSTSAVRRARVTTGAAHGVIVDDVGTFTVLEDVDVGDLDGEGLMVQDGAAAEARRIAIRNVRDVGLRMRITNPVNFSGLSAEDLRIDGVTPRRSQDTAGVSIKDTVVPVITRFDVAHVDGAALSVAQSLTMISDGTVRASAVGLQVFGSFELRGVAQGLHIAADVAIPLIRE
ncbi:hypothetical protein L6R52_13870, partial [Myxococcota bacterium]|nr:hypothetical protein [Myxococcota bacterium]